TVVRTTRASVLTAEMAPFTWFGRWFGIEGWATLGVAVMGTFALMRLWVLAIRPELGIRRAVGASRTRLFGYLMTRAIGAALAGVAIGVIFGPSFWASLHSLNPDLPTWDTRVVARYALILVGAAIAGALPPAWHALREAPVALMESAGE
ncbi:MAG: ABC transporter permease, partial [Gemmatimonadales bacterium]